MKKFFLLSVIIASALMPAKAYDFMAGGIAYNYLGAYVGDTNAANVEVVYTDYAKSTNYNGATTVSIPSTVTQNKKTYKVTSIGNFAFAYAASLKSVSIPSSVVTVGRCAFYNCPALTTVNIANGVTTISDNAFGFCANLTSIVIPNSVTSLGKSAFTACEKLASVTLSNAITEIPGQLFFDCKSLTSVNIPNAVTKIGNSAFYNCSSIKTLSLPNNLTSIGDNAFGVCSSVESLAIPNSVGSIGISAFYNCTSMKSITLPNQLTAIPDELFYKCSALTTVVIPESVTSIGESAFHSCTNLASITIPSMVNSIGKVAFFGCENLTQVKSKIVNIRDVTMGVNVFSQKTYQNATLTVPVGTVPAYRVADIWKYFNNIIDEEGNSPNGIVFSKLETFDDHCTFSATYTGNEEHQLTLKVNGETAENPFMIARTKVTQVLEAEATVEFTDPTITSLTANETYTIPALDGDLPPVVEPTFTPYNVNAPNNAQTDPAEDYYKLFDKNKSTKWCVDNSTGYWETIWVDFKSYVAFIPTKYTMTTAADTRTWSARNPKKWKIYAKANESDEWTTIVDVTDGDAAGLGTASTTDYDFNINNVNTKYQYFRFEVSEVRGRGGWQNNHYVFQLAELSMAGLTGEPPAPSVKGDITGDDKVDVEDVNAAINIILEMKTVDDFAGSADLNGDGKVDVEDVNAIINIILEVN
ncbi:MAG: leucine-rich repeat protein [Muribaculaceae bacterium]|nr:leucine-rich repeat protein [Muribaculaceae bacterium]